MYADDVKIYHKVNNKKDYNNFQKNLAAVQEWAHKWQMNINIDKCKVLHFGNKNENKTYYLKNVKIVSSKCEKILGVYIDTDCNLKQHIFYIVKKAILTACNILRAFHGCKINILISLFKTYIRSILEYATVVYFPHYTYLILLLENVQRYFTKRLTGLWDINYNERLKTCNLEKLENRRITNDLILVNKLLHNKYVSSIKDYMNVQSTNTRDHGLKLFKNHCRLDIRKNFFVNRIINVWNAQHESKIACKNINRFINVVRGQALDCYGCIACLFASNCMLGYMFSCIQLYLLSCNAK